MIGEKLLITTAVSSAGMAPLKLGLCGSGGSAADDAEQEWKLYVSNEDGRTFVIEAGPVIELLAANDSGEPVLSTPALSTGVLYSRTPGSIVAISE